MLHVGIVVNERCQASSVFAVTDLIMAANYCLNRYFQNQHRFLVTNLLGSKNV